MVTEDDFNYVEKTKRKGKGITQIRILLKRVI